MMLEKEEMPVTCSFSYLSKVSNPFLHKPDSLTCNSVWLSVCHSLCLCGEFIRTSLEISLTLWTLRKNKFVEKGHLLCFPHCFNSFLCPHIDRSGAYCFTGVCPSVCWKLNLLTFSYNFHTIQGTMLIFCMLVAFDNTQLVRIIWSRSNIKVTFLKQWLLRGH